MTTHSLPMEVYAGQSSAGKQGQHSVIYTGRWLQIAFLAGFNILVAGGMDQALGLGWNINTHVETTLHFQLCWFLGAIVGALLACPLVYILPKTFYMRFGALLITITGIIYVSVPTHYSSIIAARYISGFAVGWTTIDLVVHASELALPTTRGYCLGLEQSAISLGIGIQVIYGSQWTEDITFEANRLHGIIVLLLGLSAFGLTWLIIESPIFCIRNKKDKNALEIQQRILSAPKDDEALHFTLMDNRNYVIENENRTRFESCIEGLLPALKLLLLRGFVSFTFSLPLSWTLQVSSSEALQYDNGWPAIIFGLMRIVSVLISAYLLDKLGRKILVIISLPIMGLLSVSLGGIFSNGIDCGMVVACVLTIVYQMFTGFYVAPTSSFLGEAFPMRLKPHLIANCIICEYLLHIIVIATFITNSYNVCSYLVSVGVLMVISSIGFAMLLPETRLTTLREAQDRFRRPWYTKLY